MQDRGGGVGGRGRGVVSAPSASNCLFVCFSSFVLCCHASRSAPEVPGPSGSDCSDPDSPPQLCSLARSLLIYMCSAGPQARRDLRPCIEFSMNSHRRAFVNRENEATGGAVWIFFFSLSLSLCWCLSVLWGTLTLAVSWQARAPTLISPHAASRTSPRCLPSHRPSPATGSRAQTGDARARNPALPCWVFFFLCFVQIKLYCKTNHMKNIY